MLFEKKPPKWESTGAEPDEGLKREGFKAGYKPPAAYFNWFFNGIYLSVKELQDKLTAELKKMAFKDSVGDEDITDVDGAKIKTGYIAPERIKAASQTINGLMAAADKKKLDGVEAGANRYIHPANHSATVVTEDAAHRFATDAEKASWNNKAEKTTATQTADGLMSKADKAKLTGVDDGANNYIHPGTHSAGMITPDSTHRFVTDIEKAVYADKYTKNEVDNKFSTLETAIDWRESVATFADIARTYPSPQDGWTVNVKDTDYTYRWTGAAWVPISANSIPLSTQSLDGKMSAADKKKLDGVATGAEVNVQADWNVTDSASDAFVKNRPTKVSQFTNDSGFVPGAGGDISNTKIATAESIATEFPVPAAGDAPKTFLGKMKKFTEDFRNLRTGLLTVGMLVNNCVTDNPNLPLSAKQGKVLMDLLNQLNGELFFTEPFTYAGDTEALPPGRYYCANTVSNLPTNDFYLIEVHSWTNGAEKLIIAYRLPGGQSHQRTYTNVAKWSTWTSP